MEENAPQNIMKLRQIYISAQKNYKQPRKKKITIHTHTHTHTHKLHVRIMLIYAMKS